MMTPEEKLAIQKRYYYLRDYGSDDHDVPIDPLSYVDPTGDHLIHIAASQGDIETVRALISSGIDVNKLGDMGYTPLHHAYRSGNIAVIKFLLAHGADASIKNKFGQAPGEFSKKND